MHIATTSIRRRRTFSPRDLSAVKFWLDAGSIQGVADAANIATSDWSDSSQFKRGALGVATNMLYRADGGNGRPCIEFNGTDSQGETPSFVVAQPCYVLLVLKQLTWTINDRFFDSNTVNQAILWQNTTASPNIAQWAGSTSRNVESNCALNHIALVDTFYSTTASTLRLDKHNPRADGLTPGSLGVLDGLTLGSSGGAAQFANYQLFEIIVCDSTLSDIDRARLRQYLFRKHRLGSRTRLIHEGDSITSGTGSTGGNTYPAQFLALLTGGATEFSQVNRGTASHQWSDLNADVAAIIDPDMTTFSRCAIFVWCGTNDLAVGGRTPTQVYDDTVAYCLARRSLGFHVFVLTTLPRDASGISATFETDRQTLNTSIRNNWQTFADGLVDVAADTNIGDAGDNTDHTYYHTDDVHLNNTGYGIVAALAKTAFLGIGGYNLMERRNIAA